MVGTADGWGVVAGYGVGDVDGLQVWALYVDGRDLLVALLLCV